MLDARARKLVVTRVDQEGARSDGKLPSSAAAELNVTGRGGLRIIMFGPGLNATSGITAVVNHWLDAGIGERVRIEYVSTLDQYIPGQYLIKFGNAVRAYGRFLVKFRNPPDLVHIHLSHGMSFYRKYAIFALARLRKLKTVIHLHGSTFKEFYANGSAFRRLLIRTLFDRATGVIVLSNAWKTFVKEVSSNSRIFVVPNGAPLVEVLPDAGTVKKETGQCVIAFMGRIGGRKGTYDLLDAFSKLAGTVPQARLILGGDGETDRIRHRIGELGLSDRVQVLGWVTGKAKDAVFQQADIYALPSYNEGLPGSILEAMAAGTPIVSTPVGGIPEAVHDGVNGYLVSPGDVEALASRLERLCSDEVLRIRMGAASRSLVEQHFDIDKIVDTVVGVYQEIVDPAGRATRQRIG